MSDMGPKPELPGGGATSSEFGARAGKRAWRPVLVLLVLAPAIGELLSGSSPPLQFFNPVAFVLLVALYGCGALLIRETVVQRQLSGRGLLLLGAAYAIIEEGLTCKSFFNPYWTDTGFLSLYGRAWGVNWVWACGLTAYHAVVSITVPIFLVEARFASQAQEPWLGRRGWIWAGCSLSLVVLLGFWGFDNRQFHLLELKDPMGLARRWSAPDDSLAQFIGGQLKPKNQEIIRQALSKHSDSPKLRHALQDELNRLLSRSDLYSPGRFAAVTLPRDLVNQAAKPTQGDKLIAVNRALLECAFPAALAARSVYPFRPPWYWTLGSLFLILVLVATALRCRSVLASSAPLRKPWSIGLVCTFAFFVIGFVLPSLIEQGVKFPALLVCVIWCVIFWALGRLLSKMDVPERRLWRRGLWALGIITPWLVFALMLGIFVGVSGAKDFSGMILVALGFGLAILNLGVRWRRRLMIKKG